MNRIYNCQFDTGFHAFNHGDFDIDDFRTARAYAQDDKYRFGSKDHENLLTFSLNPNRDRDLHVANFEIKFAIQEAIINSHYV